MKLEEIKQTLDEVADSLTEIHDQLSGKVDPAITGQIDTVVSKLEQLNADLPTGSQPPPTPVPPTTNG